MATKRNPIRVWAMTKDAPEAFFLTPKLLNESPDKASSDAWLKRAYPRNLPNNLVVGPYDVSQAVERWNTHH
jgi:hypothetical protein